MSIKIYSGYDEFKYEESEVCNYIEDDYLNIEDDESEELFFAINKKTSFIDESSFYIVSDLEEEEISEEIASNLGRFKKFFLEDIHKVIFYVI